MNSHILTRPRSSRADLLSKGKNGGISRQTSKGNRSKISSSRNLYSKQGGLRRVITASLKFKAGSMEQDLELDSINISSVVTENKPAIRFYLEYAQYVQRNLDFCYKLVKRYIAVHFRAVMGKLFNSQKINNNFSQVRQRIRANQLLQY